MAKIRSQSGQALVQTLVAIGIMSILIGVTMTMFQNSQRATKQLAEKMASLDLSRITNTTLATSGVCTVAVNNPAPQRFDSSLVASATPPTVPIVSLPYSNKPGSLLLLDSTSAVSPLPYAPSLVVNKMDIVVTSCIAPPCTGASNQYNGFFRVFFANAQTTTPLAPLQFAIQITAVPDGAPFQKITSCSVGGGGGFGGHVQVFSAVGTSTFSVPTDFTSMLVIVTGGGGAANSYPCKGGGYTPPAGGTGGDSSFNGTLIGHGGTGGSGYAGGWGSPGTPGTGTGGDGSVTGGANNQGIASPGPGACPAGHDGGPGGYAYKTYTPSDIAPGSNVTVVVGAGGANTFVASSGFTTPGSGHVEVIWQ